MFDLSTDALSSVENAGARHQFAGVEERLEEGEHVVFREWAEGSSHAIPDNSTVPGEKQVTIEELIRGFRSHLPTNINEKIGAMLEQVVGYMSTGIHASSSGTHKSKSMTEVTCEYMR